MKNCVSLLSKMYESEGSFQISSLFEDDVLTKFQSIYGECDELDEDCKFTEEMVLIRRERVNGRVYNIIEMTDLERYMESAGITDELVALDRIGLRNALLENNFAIVIDPMDEAMEYVEEAKTATNKKIKKKRISKIDKAAQKIANMKKKGIKIFKKKPKSTKKSK